MLVMCVVLATNTSWAAICAKIRRLRGPIEVLRLKSDSSQVADDGRIAIMARKKMKLWCSDIIVTRAAARAKIVMKNKTVLSMGPHSRIEIQNYLQKSPAVNKLQLTYGRVRTLFRRTKGKVPTKLPEKGAKKRVSIQSRLIIKTPSAVAGVRGTDFYLSYNPEKAVTEQATISGEVEVKNEVTGQAVSVKPGNQVVVKKIDDKVVEKVKQEIRRGKPLQQIQRELGVKTVIAPPQPIAEDVKVDIRQTSALVRSDHNFVSKNAVKILGNSKNWKVPADELPLDFRDLKEEF